LGIKTPPLRSTAGPGVSAGLCLFEARPAHAGPYQQVKLVQSIARHADLYGTVAFRTACSPVRGYRI
jgi:hypothetical protein